MWVILTSLTAVITLATVGCMDIQHHHHAKRKAKVHTTPTPSQNLEVIIHHHRASNREDAERGDE